MKQIKNLGPKNNNWILKNKYYAIIEQIKRTEMKSWIDNQFQLKDKIRTNKNLHTKIIREKKNQKSKDERPKWNLQYIINFNWRA